VSLLFLITGCSWLLPEPEIVVVPDDKANFCDVEDPRRFSQEEIDVRAERWPANLRRDFKTNASWDRECTEPDIDDVEVE